MEFLIGFGVTSLVVIIMGVCLCTRGHCCMCCVKSGMLKANDPNSEVEAQDFDDINKMKQEQPGQPVANDPEQPQTPQNNR